MFTSGLQFCSIFNTDCPESNACLKYGLPPYITCYSHFNTGSIQERNMLIYPLDRMFCIVKITWTASCKNRCRHLCHRTKRRLGWYHPSKVFYLYNTYCRILFFCLQRLHVIVSVLPKEGLVDLMPVKTSFGMTTTKISSTGFCMTPLRYLIHNSSLDFILV